MQGCDAGGAPAGKINPCAARCSAKTNSEFKIQNSKFSRRPSWVHDAKEHLRLADDFAVHDAAAFRLRDTAPFFRGDFHLDEERVAGDYGLAKFHLVRAHEVADASRISRNAQEQDAADLRHRLELQHAGHD